MRNEAEGEHRASTCPLRSLERTTRGRDECFIRSLPSGCSCEDAQMGTAGCASLLCPGSGGRLRTLAALGTALWDPGAQAPLATGYKGSRVVAAKTRVLD